MDPLDGSFRQAGQARPGIPPVKEKKKEGCTRRVVVRKGLISVGGNLSLSYLQYSTSFWTSLQKHTETCPGEAGLIGISIALHGIGLDGIINRVEFLGDDWIGFNVARG